MSTLSRRILGLVVIAATLSLVACGDDDSAPSGLDAANSSELTSALSRASSGDTVVLTGDQYEGRFVVPAGVSLDGGGATISGTGPVVLDITGGGTTSTISDVTIENAGVGIVGSEGNIALIDVTVNVSVGAGILIDGADNVELTRVTASGPVTEATLVDIGEDVDPSELAALGIAVAGGEVAFTDVSIGSFAGFGAILKDCTGTWMGGVVEGNVGTSVLAEGSNVTMVDVEIRDGLKGRRVGSTTLTAYGAIVSGGGSLMTMSTTISDIAGPGVLQDDATSMHDGISVSNADLAGIWVQNAQGSDMALMVMNNSVLADNRGAGIFLKDVDGVAVEGAMIGTTEKRPTVIGSVREDIGDGMQAVGLGGAVMLRDTTLADNERIGLLFDGTGGSGIEATIDNVSVEGTGDNGVLFQNSGEDLRDEFTVASDLDTNDLASIANGDTLAVFDTIGVPSLGVGVGGLIGEQGLIGDDGQLGRWTVGESGVVR